MHYHWLSILSILAAFLGSIATPLKVTWDDMHTKHRWDAVPEDWESIGHPPSHTTIDLRIALKPHRENALIDALYEVSTPKHPRYGSHLSKEQVAELVAPHPDNLKLIESWLEHHGVPPSSVMTTHGGGWLTVTGVPVLKANDFLGASYQLYRHARTNETVLRTVGYSLPSALHGYVQTVVPTTFFGSPLTLSQTPWVNHGLETRVLLTESVTPTFLRWLYDLESYEPAATDQNVLGITGFANQYASYKDLKAFMGKFRSDGVDATFSVVKINGGGYDPDHPGDEASLNVQYTQGIAWPTPHVFYSIGGLPHDAPEHYEVHDNDAFLEWLGYTLSLENIPQTITTSYDAAERIFPVDYMESMCNLFAQLGARGVSVIFSSGNDGVGYGDCTKEDRSGVVRSHFQPAFPTTCPYVTGVGGTTGYEPEVAAVFSGGGFSNVFKRPVYQDEGVNTFFQRLGNKHSGLYNASSRGFPDVAAQSVNYEVMLDHDLGFQHGTSCAAPVVAAIISLLNDYLLSKGKPPLGFLNPWLYGRARQAFNDITYGSNPGCGTDGFAAVAGWDPVTGLGTPNFKELLDTLLVVEPTSANP